METPQRPERFFATLIPRTNEPEQYRSLAAVLLRWQREVPEAGKIVGLDEMLDGRPPRTTLDVYPYFSFIQEFSASGEEITSPERNVAFVATIAIALEADPEAAALDLSRRLEKFSVWLLDPEEYSRMMR